MTNQEAIEMLTAKAECMRRETSGIDIDCNHRNCDECDLCYKQGTIGDQRKALGVAISALQTQQWIPCNPSELPRDKRLWVTHDNGECRYVNTAYWDMTEWTDNVSDVVAYMPYIAPKPYQEDER